MRSTMLALVGVLVGSQALGGTFFNAANTGANVSTRASWLSAAGISAGTYFEDFESLAGGTNVHGDGSYFTGGLVIFGANSSAVIAAGGSSIGGSNPIDARAVEFSEGTGIRATLDLNEARYIAGYDIDHTGISLRLVYGDSTTQTFSLDSTNGSGDSAEFWGVVADTGQTIDRLEFVGVGGTSGWALDNLEYDAVPEPATWLALAAGFALRRRR